MLSGNVQLVKSDRYILVAAHLVVIVILEFVAATSHASQTRTIEVPLTGRVVDAGSDGFNADLRVSGLFVVPQIDATKFHLTGITASLTGAAGGAFWRDRPFDGNANNPPGGTWIEVSIENVFFDHVDSPELPPGASSQALLVEYQSLPLPAFAAFPVQSFEFPGSQHDLIFYMSGESWAIRSYDGLSGGALAFFRDPILNLTYSFDPLVPDYSDSDLPTVGAPQPWVESTYIPGEQTEVPPGLVPSYVLVPEPTTLLLAALAVPALALSRFLRGGRKRHTVSTVQQRKGKGDATVASSFCPRT